MNRKEIIEKIKNLQYEIGELTEQLKTYHQYQTVIILNPYINLEKYDEIKEELKNNAQVVSEIEDMGMKELAYEIKKKKKGYYVIFHWEGNAENVNTIEKYAREEDDIMKFITMQTDEEEAE